MEIEITNNSIENLQQAKAYFLLMGCSHFHMGREFPERYAEYKQLGIPQSMEMAWRQEQFDDYAAQIMAGADCPPLWQLHARMSDLLRELKTHATLVKMLQVTQFLRDVVPWWDRVIIAETINNTLIDVACGLNDIAAAQSFVALSLHFSRYVEQKTREWERCQKAAAQCNQMKRKVGLSETEGHIFPPEE